MNKCALIVLLFCLSPFAYAAQVGNVTVDDTAHLGNSNLILNGAGVRSKFIFDLYVTALYLVEKKHTLAAVLADPAEKRIALYLMDDINADNLLYGFQHAIKKNQTEESMQAMKEEMHEFDRMGHQFGRMKEGDVIFFDYLPGTGTQITVNGSIRGTIAGAAFNHALLQIWLGDKPAQEDLKFLLLGGNR